MILKQHTYTVVGRIVQVETRSQITLKVQSVNGAGAARIPGGQIRLLLLDEASRFHAEQATELLAMGHEPTLFYRAIISDLPDHSSDILFAFLKPNTGEDEKQLDPRLHIKTKPSKSVA